jgi:L-ascorbate metabolism protein UlaG (beta-lactamase superfamily)
MGRFDHLATRPARGPGDIFRWKVRDALSGKNRKDPGGYTTPCREPDRALVDGTAAQMTWIGHATFLLTLGGKRVLIDPIFRQRLGPIARLAPPGIGIEALPPIDLVLITHNHRDHLDPWSLERLGAGPQYVVPLGHAGLLRSLGAEKIVELDWWQATDLGALNVTLVPARHWSMRYPWDRNDALWGGFVVRGSEGTAYHSGDTAFFDGFAEIGKRFGGVDWAMLPIGAYEPRWFMEPQHMMPEEAVEAARMVEARRLVAMHWGTFRLTDEPLGEPPERARAAFAAAGEEGRELWVLDVGETRALRKG